METVFALIITILTPAGQPDQHRVFPMATLEQCWQNANAVMSSDIPKGARGIAAACGKEQRQAMPGEHPESKS